MDCVQRGGAGEWEKSSGARPWRSDSLRALGSHGRAVSRGGAGSGCVRTDWKGETEARRRLGVALGALERRGKGRESRQEEGAGD